MINLNTLTNEIIHGNHIERKDAKLIYEQPLNQLCKNADKIRQHFCSNKFDICTIINGKSGKCSENCKFCAQSIHHNTNISEYSLLNQNEIFLQAKKNYEDGILRYSIVTSGKSLSNSEIDKMCEIIEHIRKKIGINICVSFGLLNKQQLSKLKIAGVSRIHNNLETSKEYFPKICTTHTFDDKIKTIRTAQNIGLSVCSGGIMGLGETVNDRIELAFTLRELNIKSIPVNILNPIAGTPLENSKILSINEILRIVAVYRFILPDCSIRLAGGRGIIPDYGKSCFTSGANAAISGDMLTTVGISTKTDMKMLNELGYEVALCHG